MFPGNGAEVIYNEDGEPLGWDYPSTDPNDFYCDQCGFNHVGACRFPDDDDGE